MANSRTFNHWAVGALAATLLSLLAVSVLMVAADYQAYQCEHRTRCEDGPAELWHLTPNADGSYDAVKQADEHGQINDERWIAIGTWALVIGTAALAIFTSLLWLGSKEANRKTLVTLEESHRRELRAYIAVARARIVYDAAHKAWESRIEYQNFGRTPASDVRNFGVLWLVKWPIAVSNLKTISDDDPNASRYVLGPTAGRTKIDSEIENLGGYAHAADVNELAAGTWTDPAKIALVAFGCIYYSDVFGGKHRTWYRYYVGGNEGLHDLIADNTSGLAMKSWRMAAHSSGNEAN